MIIFAIKLTILLFLIGVIVSVFNGGQAVVHALEWLTDQVRKLVGK